MSPSKGYWDIQNIYMHIYTYSFLSFKYFLNIIALVFFFSQSGLVYMFLSQVWVAHSNALREAVFFLMNDKEESPHTFYLTDELKSVFWET